MTESDTDFTRRGVIVGAVAASSALAGCGVLESETRNHEMTGIATEGVVESFELRNVEEPHAYDWRFFITYRACELKDYAPTKIRWVGDETYEDELNKCKGTESLLLYAAGIGGSPRGVFEVSVEILGGGRLLGRAEGTVREVSEA